MPRASAGSLGAAVGVGQALALLWATKAVTGGLLTELGVFAPALQTVPGYLLLASVAGLVHLHGLWRERRRRKKDDCTVTSEHGQQTPDTRSPGGWASGEEPPTPFVTGLGRSQGAFSYGWRGRDGGTPTARYVPFATGESPQAGGGASRAGAGSFTGGFGGAATPRAGGLGSGATPRGGGLSSSVTPRAGSLSGGGFGGGGFGGGDPDPFGVDAPRSLGGGGGGGLATSPSIPEGSASRDDAPYGAADLALEARVGRGAFGAPGSGGQAATPRAGISAESATDARGAPGDATGPGCGPFLARGPLPQPMTWGTRALLALLDAEASACAAAAYSWSSPTTAALLAVWRLPATMFAGASFAGAPYGPDHAVGALALVAGLAGLVVADVRLHDAPAPRAGAAVAILSATLASARWVLQERASPGSARARAGDLARHGALAAGVLLVQGLLLEGAMLPRLAEAVGLVDPLVVGPGRKLLSGRAGAGGAREALAPLAVSARRLLASSSMLGRRLSTSDGAGVPLAAWVWAMFAVSHAGGQALVPSALHSGGSSLCYLALATAAAWAGVWRGTLGGGFTNPALMAFLSSFAAVGYGLVAYICAASPGAGQSAGLPARSPLGEPASPLAPLGGRAALPRGAEGAPNGGPRGSARAGVELARRASGWPTVVDGGEAEEGAVAPPRWGIQGAVGGVGGVGGVGAPRVAGAWRKRAAAYGDGGARSAARAADGGRDGGGGAAGGAPPPPAGGVFASPASGASARHERPAPEEGGHARRWAHEELAATSAPRYAPPPGAYGATRAAEAAPSLWDRLVGPRFPTVPDGPQPGEREAEEQPPAPASRWRDVEAADSEPRRARKASRVGARRLGKVGSRRH